MPDNKSSIVSINLNTVFIDEKAYSLGVNSTGKFRIAITSKVDNEWNFKNQTAIYVNHGVLSKIILACEDMIRIFTHRMLLKNMDVNHPAYNTKRIRIPLIAYTNSVEYGEFIVGITNRNMREYQFYIQYGYQDKDGSAGYNKKIEDFVIFKNNESEGGLEYIDDNGVKIHSQPCKYTEIITFVDNLRSLYHQGKILIGLYSTMMYKLGNSGGFSQTKGGQGPASYNAGSSLSEDDIPF